MLKSVEISGRVLEQITCLSLYTSDAILLHTQEVVGSNPASRTIAPRRSVGGEAYPDAPECTKMTVFGPEFSSAP
jgi:hypothetical protein